MNWVALLAEPKAKLQTFWSARLQELRAKALRDSLGQDDQVDLRSAGGPGAGGFLEAPVLFEDEVPKPMPDKHFQVCLADRLRLPVCPPGGGTAPCVAHLLTAVESTPSNVKSGPPGRPDTTA